jgi:hypothetical protein
VSRASAAFLLLLVVVLGAPEAIAAADEVTAAGPRLTRTSMDAIKATLAIVGALVLCGEAARRRWGVRWGRPSRYTQIVVVLGLVAGLCWWDLFHFHFRKYFHWWEFYHYYVAAKYYPELGYERLYVCTVIADADDRYVYDPQRPLMRDLATNRLVPVEPVVKDRAACTSHFTEARWQSFKHDVAWFREPAPRKLWTYMLTDFGFNGSPAWLVLGSTLANTGPASSAQMLILSLIDPAFLVGMWAFVWATFGGPATSVALIWWGTNFPAFFGWTGGAYLRQDWLIALVVGIGLLYRRRWLGAGFFLTVAAALRVFPVFALAALGVSALLSMLSARRIFLGTEYRRLALGCGLAVAVILSASVLVAGVRSWPEWARDITKHAGSHGSNFTGLRAVMAYDHDTRAARTARLGLEEDAFRIWTSYRDQTLAARWLPFVGLMLGFSLLVLAAVRCQPPWVVAVLGLGLTPVLTAVSSYYYAFLLLFGLVGWLRPSLGIALCLLAAATQAVQYALVEFDEQYTAISVLMLAFVTIASVLMLRRPVTSAEQKEDIY